MPTTEPKRDLTPEFRMIDEVLLSGTMSVYHSQQDLTERTPLQWMEFKARHPELASSTVLYGASPCTNDGKIHYFTGVVQKAVDESTADENLALGAGEYAVLRVEDVAKLRETWTWLLQIWLPSSGRREKRAPEFERFAGVLYTGEPVAPVDIFIPLEPPAMLEEKTRATTLEV